MPRLVTMAAAAWSLVSVARQYVADTRTRWEIRRMQARADRRALDRAVAQHRADVRRRDPRINVGFEGRA